MALAEVLFEQPLSFLSLIALIACSLSLKVYMKIIAAVSLLASYVYLWFGGKKGSLDPYACMYMYHQWNL